jgi:hypothetical protein
MVYVGSGPATSALDPDFDGVEKHFAGSSSREKVVEGLA